MMKRRIQILGVAGIAIFLAILGNSKSLVLWTQWIIIGDPKEEILNKTYTVGKYQIREQIYKYSGFPDSVYDYKYHRVYTIRENSFWPLDTGRFEYTNRRQIGIQTAIPKIVGEWLVIFSDRQTVLWKHNHKPIQFEPNETSVPELAQRFNNQYPLKSGTTVQGTPQNIFPPNLANGSAPKLKNIYLDYQAINFYRKGDRWFFEYHCNQDCQNGLRNQLPPQLKCSSNPGKPLFSDCTLVSNISQKFSNIIFYSDDQGKTFHMQKH